MSGLLKNINMAYIRRRLTGEPSAAAAKEQPHTAAAKHKTAGDALREPETVKCPKCGKNLDKQRVITHKYICYECGAYFRVRTNNRIRMIADPGTFEEWNRTMPLSNPLNYEGYPEKLAECGVLAYPLDYMSPKIPGLGDVDWGAYVSALNDIRYDGDAVIEVEDKAFEGSKEDILTSIRLSKHYLDNFIG